MKFFSSFKEDPSRSPVATGGKVLTWRTNPPADEAAIFESPAQPAPDRLPGHRSSLTYTSARSRDSLERVRGSPLVAQHDTPAAALTYHDASMAFREYSRSRCPSPSNASGVSRAALNHAVQYSTIREHECRRFQP